MWLLLLILKINDSIWISTKLETEILITANNYLLSLFYDSKYIKIKLWDIVVKIEVQGEAIGWKFSLFFWEEEED